MKKEEFGRWVVVGETFQQEEVGEGLTLGRVRRLRCLTVDIAGSGVGQTWVYKSQL